MGFYDDTQLIERWLNGDKAVKTKIQIVARSFTEKDRQNSGSEHAFLPYANSTHDLEILKNEALNGLPESLSEEVFEIDGVRIKYGGVKPDLSFRVSSFQFIWEDYYGYIKDKELRAVRFYFEVVLIDKNTNESKVLLRTDFYKIKEAEIIYSTGKSEGADARIEAIPWIYEYNEKLTDGVYAIPFVTKDMYINSKGYDYDSEVWSYFIRETCPYYTDDWWRYRSFDAAYEDVTSERRVDRWAPASFAFSWNGLSRMQKIYHDRRKILDPQYPGTNGQAGGPGIFVDDAPCPYLGPVINSLSSIEYSELDYNFRSFYGTPLTYLENMGPRKVSVACKESFLTLFSWKSMGDGELLRAVTYRGNRHKPLDIPSAQFIEVLPILSGNYWDVQDINKFDIEESDSEVYYRSAYRYEYDISSVGVYVLAPESEAVDYIYGPPPTVFYSSDYFASEYSMGVSLSGLIEGELDTIYTPDDPDPEVWYKKVQFSSSYLLSYVLDGTGSDNALSEVGYSDIGTYKSSYFTCYQAQIDGKEMSVYFAPGDLGDSVESPVKVIMPMFFKCRRHTANSMVPYTADVKRKLIKVDSKGVFTFSGGKAKELLTCLSLYTKGIKFKAEWRPWIQVYEVIEVHLKDEFGQNLVAKALVLSIDANVDKMAAEYDCLVLLDGRRSIGLQYTEYEDRTVLAGIGTCTDSEIFIPERHNGKPVVAVAEGAFEGVNSVKKVVIPSSVKTVSDRAFYGCSDLEQVFFETGVEKIGESAFENCEKLFFLNTPDSLTRICRKAFNGTRLLKWGHCKVDGEDYIAYNYVGNWIISDRLAGRPINSLDMSAVKEVGIADEAFIDRDIRLLDLEGSSVRYIGEKAFFNNSRLAEIHISYACERVEKAAFGSTSTSLKTYFMGSSSAINYIGMSAFGSVKEVYGLSGTYWRRVPGNTYYRFIEDSDYSVAVANANNLRLGTAYGYYLVREE